MNHSAGKHDRGPLFFTFFSFRLIRSRSTGLIFVYKIPYRARALGLGRVRRASKGILHTSSI